MTTTTNRLVDWFQEWHGPLRRFLLRRRAGPAADIDDIAQEVFLRLLRYERSELIDHPQAYLFKIATNVAAEWATRSSRIMPHSAEWLADLVDELDPETEIDQEVAEAELLRAIRALQPRPREIVRLHFGEGMTYENIARQLGLSRRIVKRDLARAYATMRAMLDPSLAEAAAPWLNSDRQL